MNMIVKNESEVITRCLETVKPIIDYWVIVDTGSTDGTQEIIKDFMKDVSGELHETPWVNFEHNRNHAMSLAKNKADYLLIIDADEVLAIAENFKMPQLDKDFYFITTQFGGTEYGRVQLVNNHLDWKWVGVLHEALMCDGAKTSETLKGLNNVVYTDGARSKDPLKYQKDALLLQTALEKDPTNTRYMFYLAQSWKDAGEHAKAIECYKKRIAMGGWEEEVFWSMLQIAHMEKELGMPPEKFLSSYYNAYHFRNTRQEPLFYISKYYRTQGNYAQAYLIASTAAAIPPSKDLLFVEQYIRDYELEFELSIAAYWIGKYKKCQTISRELLKRPNLPDNIRDRIEKNLACTRTKLLQLYDPIYNPI